MKRILLTSAAALIASAGMVAAEVKTSGQARFGIKSVEDQNMDDVNASDAAFTSRFRVNVDVKTVTDGGTEFGGRIRVQADSDKKGDAGQAKLNAPNFYVQNGGLQVVAGNTGGAVDNMPNYYGNEVGLTTFIGQYSGVSYGIMGYASGYDSDKNSNSLQFNYGVDSFKFIGAYRDRVGTGRDQNQWDMGVQYGFGDITVAAAYGQTSVPTGSSDKKESLAVLTLGFSAGPFDATVLVADDGTNDEMTKGTAYGLSATYGIGAATKLVFAFGDGSGKGDTQALGLGFAHDLGNGAALKGGWGRKKEGADAEAKATFDFGASFDF